ncbi:hypothetical protein [Roseisolibacter sp. H3M3-2]|uniref:hypothetical protein n=1 Tax=Roseisolibacter sp. H3M3-2 TaxID=3031323 RepID=UPI0023DB0DCB|nr:hypothetical protein [Roseisolibacter sp. H3M3-2]MDF1504043.1 hypothetical protein [Roseisolibacter sp. H3M3-2]MDF1504048.1 hypothetical protein [Roseisolibacter sp. H3M3-2]
MPRATTRPAARTPARAAAAATTTKLLRVPAEEATRILRTTIRFVADLPPRSTGAFVWTQGDSELQVDAFGVTLACAPGLVTVGVPVSCDQVEKPVTVPVPIAVGTPQRPAGLVMTTFDRVAAPPLIAGLWSEAIAAFAWEALVHLAQQLAAQAGKDAQGRPFVPLAVAADARLLLVQPAPRIDLGTRTAR